MIGFLDSVATVLAAVVVLLAVGRGVVAELSAGRDGQLQLSARQRRAYAVAGVTLVALFAVLLGSLAVRVYLELG